MMKRFEDPEIMVEKFTVEDIISTSGNGVDNGDDNTNDQEM